MKTNWIRPVHVIVCYSPVHVILKNKCISYIDNYKLLTEYHILLWKYVLMQKWYAILC